MSFSVSLEEHGRHECAAALLMGLVYPESIKPGAAFDTLFNGLCGYLLRVSGEQPDGWAEDRQLMRPIHAFASQQQVERAQRDIATRLPKALWAGLVASELITGVRPLGKPGDRGRKSVAPIAEDMAGYLQMSASNFKGRAWRPWARSAHLCATFANLHMRCVEDGEPRFRLVEFLISSDAGPLAFSTIAASLEDAVVGHSKIPTDQSGLLRIRVSEKGS